MDYPVLNYPPNTAEPAVIGYLDANGKFIPAAALTPVPVVSGGGSSGAPSGAVQTVQQPEDGATLTKAAVSMTGASGVLVAASASRLSVIVSNPAANAVAAFDPTGGTCSLTAGIPLAPGETAEITGKAAQSAMTQIGTNTQVLTVYTGA